LNKWITTTNILGPSGDPAVKARADITKIAETIGYQPLNIFPYNDTGETHEEKASRIDGITANVISGDIVIIQYPMANSHLFSSYLIDRMNMRGVHTIVLMHQFDSGKLDNTKDDFVETNYLNKATAVIVHGKDMIERLQQADVETPIVDASLFDHLDDLHSWDHYETHLSDFRRELIVTGDLMSLPFLANWSATTPIMPFGLADDKLMNAMQKNPQVHYGGNIYHWDLVETITRGFGLEWISSTEMTPEQETAHQLRLAFYIAHGLPVVVSATDHQAKLIVQNKLGFAIESLQSLDDVMQNSSDEAMATVLDHTARVGQLMRDGWFTTNALLQVERLALMPLFSTAGADIFPTSI